MDTSKLCEIASENHRDSDLLVVKNENIRSCMIVSFILTNQPGRE